MTNCRCFFIASCFFMILSGPIFSEDFPKESYKGPEAIVATRDGSRLYVVHHDADEIAEVDLADEKVVRNLSVGKNPRGLLLNTDENLIYVTSGHEFGLVQCVDVRNGKIVKEVSAGHTPCGLALSPDGKRLFVCNRFCGHVYEYSLPELMLTRKIKAQREPRDCIATKDGKSVIVINYLPNAPTNYPEDPEADIYVSAEVTVIDVGSGETRNIILPNGTGSVHGICLSGDGRYVYVTEILARFQVPTTQVERGWMNTNALTIIDTRNLDNSRKGFVNTVLIDDVDRGAANPWGVTTSADGKEIYIAVTGTNELIVIDAAAMHEKLASLPIDEELSSLSGAGGAAQSSGDVPNDLSFLARIKKRISLDGKGARELVAVGKKVYVGMYFSDMLQKVDLEAMGEPKNEAIPLGPKPQWTKRRRGEIHWSDASHCFQHWQSCASCHPDARMDAYNWDLLNDGIGNPKNTKSLLWCDRCPPAMWTGVRTSSQVCTRTGFQHILFTVPDENICTDIDEYVHSLKPVASPYLVNGELSEKAKRGKRIFENPKVGCAKCHPGPLFTDQKKHDVGTRCYYDRRDEFDTPTLIECWRTAPYLHDGRYLDMKELFKEGKHGDVLGDIDSLNDEQIDDLVEYILSL